MHADKSETAIKPLSSEGSSTDLSSGQQTQLSDMEKKNKTCVSVVNDPVLIALARVNARPPGSTPASAVPPTRGHQPPAPERNAATATSWLGSSPVYVLFARGGRQPSTWR